jgi:hypothetical protein
VGGNGTNPNIKDRRAESEMKGGVWICKGRLNLRGVGECEIIGKLIE